MEEAGASAHRVLEILSGLAGAVRHLHHRGLIHRFVAPENLVVSPEAGAVLIDYGHVWSAEHEFSTPSDLEGASGYAAPEIARGDPEALAPPVDLYGLAATGFALLTGKPPRKHIRPRGVLDRVREENPERWDVADEAAEALVGLLVKGLAADPALRPDAAACEAALDEALAHVAAPRSAPPAPADSGADAEEDAAEEAGSRA